MDNRKQPAPYELDIAPDGERWRYRKRWRAGVRRFLPSFWHVTDEDGLRALRRQEHLRS